MEEEEKKIETNYDELIQKATNAAVRLEAANEASAILQENANKDAIKRTLAGESLAGKEQEVPQTEEEKITEESKKMLAGTGFEDLL